MKRLKYVLPIILALVAGFVFVGCQQQPATEDEVSDTDMMKESTPVSEQEGPGEPYYVLIVGNDSREGTTEITNESYSDGTGRSDTMILARIDPSSYQVTLVTVPRDTTTDLNGTKVKINEVYRQKGIEASVDEVEALTGVEIEYYFNMGFVEFEAFINALNGITADVPIDMSLVDIVSGNEIELSAGEQELDGAQSLVLARVRKLYANDHDACRQIQNRQIVEVAMKQIAANPALVSAGVDALLANAKTNWNKEDLVETITDFAGHADQIKYLSGTGPYAGATDAEAQDQWLVPRDVDTWKALMKVVDEGGDPTTVVALPPVSAAG